MMTTETVPTINVALTAFEWNWLANYLDARYREDLRCEELAAKIRDQVEGCNDSEYVYLPEYDGEWSIMLRGEYNTTGGWGEYGPAQPAELAFNLDGFRGHYLAADFIQQAWHVLGSSVTMTEDEARRLEKAKTNSETYHEHQELGSGKPSCDPETSALYHLTPLCSACEFINEDADAVEAILSDHRYVTEWDDGVRVYKVS